MSERQHEHEARRRSAGPGLLRRWAETRSPRRVKVSTALRLYHEVFGLDHLHYGLWDGEALDLNGLRSAQERYAAALLDWIPAGARTILDVGAGTGALSRLLRDRGYEVEGLSPDPYQRRLYEARVGRPFHLVRFQELEAPHPYDVVLMGESAQYVWLDRLFPAVRRAAPGGHLLVADYFRRGEVEGRGSGHGIEDFRRTAAAEGLDLLREEDVTEATVPTLDLARRWLEERVDPALAILGEAATHRHPRLFALARRLFAGRVRKVEEARRQLDGDHFRRTRRYLFLLYRVPAA